jgi:transcriptional regulator with XRE-family HTH domain
MPALLEPHDLANLGAFLRDGRERRGLTIDQIASTTRIPRRHLDALEHGDLDVIPGGMYRRAEVRAFADAVGIDRNLALARLEEALDRTALPEPAQRPVLDPPRRQWGAYAALALLAAGALAVATRGQWTTPATQVERAREVAAPAVAEPTDGVTPAAVDAPPQTAGPPATSSPEASPATASDLVVEPASTVAPPVETALVVTSTPAGARVLVDGIGWGRTPLTISNIAPGDRRIRVVLDGFVSAERRVRVVAGRGHVTAHVDLTAAN